MVLWIQKTGRFALQVLRGQKQLVESMATAFIVPSSENPVATCNGRAIAINLNFLILKLKMFAERGRTI